MPLPPFTLKSCLVYLIGVAAALLIVYQLIMALYHATPRKRVNLQPTSGAVASLECARGLTDRCGQWLCIDRFVVKVESGDELTNDSFVDV
jgi:hypothetical protein